MKRLFLAAALLATPAAALDMQAVMRGELYGMARLPDLRGLPELGKPADVTISKIPSFETFVVKFGLSVEQAPYARAFLQKWNEMASMGDAFVVGTRHCDATGKFCALMLTGFSPTMPNDGFENRILFIDDDYFEFWTCKGTFDKKTAKPIGARFCGATLTGERSLEKMSRDGHYFMLGRGNFHDVFGQEGEMRFLAHEKSLER